MIPGQLIWFKHIQFFVKGNSSNWVIPFESARTNQFSASWLESFFFEKKNEKMVAA
jgi:hypothetical protein